MSQNLGLARCPPVAMNHRDDVEPACSQIQARLRWDQTGHWLAGYALAPPGQENGEFQRALPPSSDSTLASASPLVSAEAQHMCRPGSLSHSTDLEPASQLAGSLADPQGSQLQQALTSWTWASMHAAENARAGRPANSAIECAKRMIEDRSAMPDHAMATDDSPFKRSAHHSRLWLCMPGLTTCPVFMPILALEYALCWGAASSLHSHVFLFVQIENTSPGRAGSRFKCGRALCSQAHQDCIIRDACLRWSGPGSCRMQ